MNPLRALDATEDDGWTEEEPFAPSGFDNTAFSRAVEENIRAIQGQFLQRSAPPPPTPDEFSRLYEQWKVKRAPLPRLAPGAYIELDPENPSRRRFRSFRRWLRAGA